MSFADRVGAGLGDTVALAIMEPVYKTSGVEKSNIGYRKIGADPTSENAAKILDVVDIVAIRPGSADAPYNILLAQLGAIQSMGVGFGDRIQEREYWPIVVS